MDRIIIAVKEIKKENWEIIYQFIKSIAYDEAFIYRQKAFLNLITIAQIRLNTGLVPKEKEEATDVYSLYGDEITYDRLGSFATNTCFSILYQKQTDEEDFAGLVPFVFFQHEFGDKVSLGIDITNLNKQSYVFKCSDFFILFDETKPKLGKRNFYFINTKGIRIVDKETGEMRIVRTMSFAGKGENENSQQKYEGKPSRKFLPLLRITNNNYKTIFGINGDGNSAELRFVNESTNKIKKEWTGKKPFKAICSKLNEIFDNLESPFGRWFESSYFYSYDKELKSFKPEKIQGIRNTLQVYKDSIQELVQNIIFHGGGEGLLYCTFDKKTNLSKSSQMKIQGIDNLDDNTRFLRIGIFDFGKNGIIDTFKSNINDDGIVGLKKKEIEHLILSDFFDPNSIVTTGLSHLEMRYAARLGIKTFVKTIVSHKGYFSVESNEHIGNKRIKRFIQTSFADSDTVFSNEKEVDFSDGTHYEIILPVVTSENYANNSPHVQTTSLLSDEFARFLGSSQYQIKAIDISEEDIGRIANSMSKESQVNSILSVCKSLFNKVGDDKKVIALDLKNRDFDIKIVYKIAAYLQLTAAFPIEKLFLINTTDEFTRNFCGFVNSFLISSDNSDSPIWSRDTAIIVISIGLHTQIIWGRTKDELYYINQQCKKLYYNNFFTTMENAPFDNGCKQLCTNGIEKRIKRFVFPYDMLITTEGGSDGEALSLFESFMVQILRRKVFSKGLGFLVNHENTYIGKKIIVKNYYEADTLFQNNFFVERLAYLIAQNIRKKIYDENNQDENRRLVLIGYKHYSEFLLKTIKRLLKPYQISLIICNEEKENSDDDELFNFGVDTEADEEKLKSEILNSPDGFLFSTLVPIGATLSTNDKIISFFLRWFEKESEKITSSISSKPVFIYNHCAIVVRDKIREKATELEQNQRWKENINFSKRFIETLYNNANIVYYTIQIANSNNSDGNWEKRLNNSISFPKNWEDEQYVNFTENSSINSQNLMGFPEVELCEEEGEKEELERVFMLKDYIYKGHIDALNCHHRFFIDTESFVKKENAEIGIWLGNSVRKDNDKKTRMVFGQDMLNVLITPNVEIESDFVSTVNQKVFDDKALIIYLDVNNWRNNIVHKLSFLKSINNVRYHYVDHALLTGETYNKSKSYLFSIIDSGQDKKEFDSVITLVNRLPFAKSQEIKREVIFNMFSFVNLHYPTSKDGEQECELCKLGNYYKDLNKKTVLESCNDVINKNLEKIKVINKEAIKARNKKENCEQGSGKRKRQKRVFLRLVMTHDLFYKMSKLARENDLKDDYYFEKVKNSVRKELDDIYIDLSCEDKIGQQNKNTCLLNLKVNEWYKNDIFSKLNSDLNEYYNRRLITDKRISFLKVISSPPLSQYIIMRDYAHKKLLEELFKTINKEEKCVFDDLKIIKSVLKSLSFLKSNALVRIDVIIGVWKILWVIISKLDSERERIIDYSKFISNYLKSLEEEIKKYEDGSKQDTLYDSVEDLRKKKVIASNFLDELSSEMKMMNKTMIVQDFSRDVQFFIKNAILEDESKATFLGELLRRGNEISDFSETKISKTLLFLRETGEERNKKDSSLMKVDEQNELFIAFNDNKDDFFRREYTSFLVWLFYDNTTIIRNTLENFSKEIDKDRKFYDKFYNEKKEPIRIAAFKDDINAIKMMFTDKVENEYYYTSFKPYLRNGDGIDFVEKLLYVTYAKLKLEDLTTNKHKTRIESDTRDLMEVFAAIMGADAAFWTMKKENNNNIDESFSNIKETAKDFRIYPISLYDKDYKNKWDYDLFNIDSYYTYQIYTQKELPYPLIPKYSIKQVQGENNDLKKHSLGVYTISEKFEEKESNDKKETIVSCITFLYKDSNPIVSNEKEFRIKFQESGRLLLLLKNEINTYVVGYLRQEKVFELWEKVHLSSRRFEKIYANSSHVFNSVYKEMEEFEQLDESTIKKLSKTWFFLTNETISFLYSTIERNPEHYLNLDKFYVVDEKNTLGKTFNKAFICVLSALLDSRWNSQKDNLKNVVYINGQLLDEFKIADNLKDVKFQCNKHLIRTFIAQCLHNSLSPLGNHGHRYSNEIKRVDILISDSEIRIKDSCLVKVPKEVKIEQERLFLRKKKYIKALECDEYSSTTLTSLQGFVDYMHFSCDYGFNKEYDFEVSIKYK